MIERSTPDVGYIDPAMFAEIGTSQMVKAQGQVHFSGIVAAGPDATCVAPNDPRGQIKHVLHILGELLKSQGMTFANVVSTTTFTTDIDTLRENADLFTEVFKENPPTSTWIGVQKLTFPEYFLEFQVIAAE